MCEERRRSDEQEERAERAPHQDDGDNPEGQSGRALDVLTPGPAGRDLRGE